MNILSIDSSTKRLSAAVSRDDKLLLEVTDNSGTGHMVNVVGLLDRALSKLNLALKEIDVFGVNLGPGDFTGTRIGVSVIKILSWLEEKPAFGINSLDAVAVGMVLKNNNFIISSFKKNISVMVMPCLDVRREEVYFAFYNITPELDNKNEYLAGIRSRKGHYFIRRTGESFLIGYSSLKSVLNNLIKNGILKIPGSETEYRNPKILIGGNCYLSYREILSDIIRQNRIFSLDKKMVYPWAEFLNVCVYFNAVRKVETKNLIPVYVREFIPFGSKQNRICGQ